MVNLSASAAIAQIPTDITVIINPIASPLEIGILAGQLQIVWQKLLRIVKAGWGRSRLWRCIIIVWNRALGIGHWAWAIIEELVVKFL